MSKQTNIQNEESSIQKPEIRRGVMHLSGKYMTFKLGIEEYGVEILKVKELIQLTEITRVPRTKEFIRGVINLRGKVIPVIDIKLKFGMGRTESTDMTVIIVLQYILEGNVITMGMLVDEVLEVFDFPSTHIEPPPNFGSGSIDTEFILGVGKQENRVIFLLDISKVLTATETEQLASAAFE